MNIFQMVFHSAQNMFWSILNFFGNHMVYQEIPTVDNEQTFVEVETVGTMRISQVDNSKLKKLLEFIRKVDVETVSSMLEKHPSLVTFQSEEFKTTPLIAAIESGTNKDGKVPNAAKMVKLILKHGADVKQVIAGENTSPLFKAIEKKNLDILKEILEATNDVNDLGTSSMTPLQYAVIRKDFDAVYAILKHKNLDINKQDQNGNTALHEAVCKNDVPIVFMIATSRFRHINFGLKNRNGLTVRQVNMPTSRISHDCLDKIISRQAEFLKSEDTSEDAKAKVIVELGNELQKQTKQPLPVYIGNQTNNFFLSKVDQVQYIENYHVKDEEHSKNRNNEDSDMTNPKPHSTSTDNASSDPKSEDMTNPKPHSTSTDNASSDPKSEDMTNLKSHSTSTDSASSDPKSKDGDNTDTATENFYRAQMWMA